MSKFIKLGTLALAVLAATLVGPAQAEVSDARSYSNQTPYGDPASTPIVAPPLDYNMLFIETVGRHGSRSNVSSAAETRALKVWKAAKKKRALTKVGKKFASDLKWFQAAERNIGYGNLSNVGKDEWAGIGRRTAQNYSGFLASAQIAFVTSGVHRTQQSADAMKAGLDAQTSGLTYVPTTTDTARLLLPSGSTTQGRAGIAKIKKASAVKAAAKHVLRRLYSKKYVNKLKDPVGKALDIYLLYCTAPGMAGNTRVNFASYVPLKDARMLGYVKDAENFYSYGPGAIGQNNSFVKAAPLLNDFFTQLDARISGGTTDAVFRLAHGETTMPFAALIKAPGSEVQAPYPTRYSYANNPWRGYVAGRLAGNIEWVAYAKTGSPALVTMRYNEQPVDFKAGCVPTVAHFYTVAELKRCLL